MFLKNGTVSMTINNISTIISTLISILSTSYTNIINIGSLGDTLIVHCRNIMKWCYTVLAIANNHKIEDRIKEV